MVLRGFAHHFEFVKDQLVLGSPHGAFACN